MNRRNPTRIELKLDDMDEYEGAKRDADESAIAKDAAVNTEPANDGSHLISTSSSEEKTARQTTPDKMGLRLAPRS